MLTKRWLGDLSHARQGQREAKPNRTPPVSICANDIIHSVVLSLSSHVSRDYALPVASPLEATGPEGREAPSHEKYTERLFHAAVASNPSGSAVKVKGCFTVSRCAPVALATHALPASVQETAPLENRRRQED